MTGDTLARLIMARLSWPDRDLRFCRWLYRRYKDTAIRNEEPKK